MNHEWHKKYGIFCWFFDLINLLRFVGSVVRIAPNHLSFSDHSAQKIIYGFGTKVIPSMKKDPIFFTPEVDHSMNIINECDKEEHTRMRRMLSFAFSMSNVMENDEVLMRRTDEFLDVIGRTDTEHGQRGIDIVQKFNYVTFDIMGEMSFGDSWDIYLAEQLGQFLFSISSNSGLEFCANPRSEHHFHWADVIVNTTFMNDVMRAVVCIPGLFSFLERFPPVHSRKTLYRHAKYATEHTQAYVSYSLN